MITLMSIVSFFFIAIAVTDVFARGDMSELEGTWEFTGAMMDDEIYLASELGMSGEAIIDGSVFSLRVSGQDTIYGFLSAGSREGIYIIKVGDESVGVCALAGEYLAVQIADDITLLFEMDSFGSYSSILGDYSDTYSNSYRSGTYIVGEDIPAGEYVFFANSGTDGYFAVYESKYSSDIKQNDLFSYNSIMNINYGEKIELERCYAVPIRDAKVDTNQEGMFKIGTHLSPGNYHVKATSSSDGYYCIYSDNEQDDIRDNDLFEGDAYFSVQYGEYLVPERCRIVN